MIGIGGIYYDAKDPERLEWWYEKYLGIKLGRTSVEESPWHQQAGPGSITFSKREPRRPNDPKDNNFQMTCFRVRNLDAMVAQLQSMGIEVRIRKHDVGSEGRTATVFDPELNAVQLWEPCGSLEVVVRAATPTDIPLLADLMSEFYTASGTPLDRAKAGAGFAGLLFNKALGAVWIVSDEGRAAGYAALTVRFSLEHGGLCAFVDGLFVRPPHRRRGLARALLKEVLAECGRRGALAIHAEVTLDDKVALALYATQGLAPKVHGRKQLSFVFGTNIPVLASKIERQEKGKPSKQGKSPRGRPPKSSPSLRAS